MITFFWRIKKARKHKTTKDYVLEFENKLNDNLLLLCSELLLHSHKPNPLVNFIIRDPKTRKISKSDFRDRIVHHSLCNIIEPIFEKVQSKKDEITF
jgi:retron-type reverse transcriptase